MKIAVVTHYDENFKSVGDITSANNREYCERHEYDFICHREKLCPPEWHSVWDKIWVCMRSLQMTNKEGYRKYDWIMYVDSDAMIMNHNIKLETLIDDDFNWIIANDVNGLNSGIFLLRNCTRSLNFLGNCWDRRHNIANKTEAEQTAMKQFIAENPNYPTKFISPRLINSYLYPRYGYPPETEGNFEKGDFILHLPGMHNHDRVTILNEYKQYIIK